MILRKRMPCALCGGLCELRWETVSQNNLTVHNVPLYRCDWCGEEWLELTSAIPYDEQVEHAYANGLAEITLVYPDVTLIEWDAPMSEEE